ncbi:Probable ubiquitin-like-specific protease 2A [Linum perenne]
MNRSPMVNAKPRAQLSVFDFIDDEFPEKASKAFIRRLGTRKQPKREASPVSKYKFLELFVGRKESFDVDDKGPPEKKGSFEPIDVEDKGLPEKKGSFEPIDVEDKGRPEKKASFEPIDVEDKGPPEKKASFEPIDVDDEPVRTCSAVVEGWDGPSMDISVDAIDNARDLGNLQGQPLSIVTQKDHVAEETQPLVLSSDSDNEIDMQESVVSTSTSSEKEDFSDKQVVKLHSVGHKIDSTNSAVSIFTDYVCYGDVYCARSRITFSCHCVRVESSNTNGTTWMLNAEWPVHDIVSFQSQWWQGVESALVKLHFRSKTSTRSSDGDGTSGTESLNFAAYDPHWSEGLVAIKSLNPQYANVWSCASVEEDESGSVERICCSTSQPSVSRPGLDGNHKQVVYPIDDPDAILISTSDLVFLQPDTFINDTIIDFYVKYLIKYKIQQEDQNRFHFFNCFFFRKLADLDKHLPSVCEGKDAFQRVYKWTKKVNLFKKDYIFIPVNYSLHWSLIVICHPGEVALLKDDGNQKSAKMPCILHMNSIQGSHRGLKNIFRSYLAEEWKVRHHDMVDDVSSKFADLRFIQLKLPQQGNSFDCGLFLLHYLELFLELALVNFNPSNLSDYSNVLNKNWFAPDEASLKRGHIKQLLSELLSYNFKGNHMHQSSQNCDAHKEEAAVETPGEQLADALRSDIWNPLIATSPPRTYFDRIGDTGIAFQKLSGPETSPRSLFDEIYQWKQTPYSINLSPIQETEECVLATEDCFSETEDCLWETGKSPIYTSLVGEVTSPGAPRKQKDMLADQLSNECGSHNSSEIGVDDGDDLHSASEQRQHHTKSRKLEFLSASSQELKTCVVEDSEEENSLQDDCVVVEDSISSIHGQFDYNAGEEVISKAKNEVHLPGSDVSGVDG